MTRSKAVFLDRDGTIIRDVNYLHDPSQLELLPKSEMAIRLLNQCGFKVVVITNQSAIARGYVTEKELAEIHAEFRRLLENRRASIDAIYYCPHLPDQGCGCRKPRTKLFERAVEEHKIDPAESYTVGDKQTDIIAGKRIGTMTALVLSGNGKKEDENLREWDVKPDYIGSDLLDAVKWVFHVERTRRDITRSYQFGRTLCSLNQSTRLP